VDVASIAIFRGTLVVLRFTVGLIQNLSALYDFFRQFGWRKMRHIEIDVLGAIGKQDQYASAFGGLNHFMFIPTEEQRSNGFFWRLTLSSDWRPLILILLGITRSASTILHEQASNLATRIFEA
jgi:D-glycero-alpha-D-manno-heptose-7-phosphate kinase